MPALPTKAGDAELCDPVEMVAQVRAGDLGALDRMTRCYGERLLAVGQRYSRAASRRPLGKPDPVISRLLSILLCATGVVTAGIARAQSTDQPAPRSPAGPDSIAGAATPPPTSGGADYPHVPVPTAPGPTAVPAGAAPAPAPAPAPEMTPPLPVAAVPLSFRDLIDTRVTFAVADADLGHGPSGGSPAGPTAFAGADNRLFFDDFERRDTGFENLSHLVLFARAPGFIEGLDTAAALVIRMEILGDRGVALSEDGSHIDVAYALADGARLELTAFPLNADRLRLGNSYDITWGDSRIFGLPAAGARASPGARLRWRGEHLSAWAGWKSALTEQLQPDQSFAEDAAWAVLAGGRADIVDELRMELGGGFFDLGTINRDELRVISANGAASAPPRQAYGGSVQLTYHVGIPIGTPIDFRLYENDPLEQQRFFAPETYGEGLSFTVQSEASVVGQTLMDPDHPSSTTNQFALAIDLGAKVKLDRARFHLLAVFRNLEFILLNTPSLTPFVAFPAGITPAPEFFLSAGADYSIESLGLTPGLVVGFQLPAHITADVPDLGGLGTRSGLGVQTIVIRDARRWELLNPGGSVAPIFAGKLTARFDLSEILAAIGELQLTYDANLRRAAQDTNGALIYLPGDPTKVGFNVMLQARF